MIKERDKKKFQKCVAELNTLIEKIREYEPEANYFVAGEGITTIAIHRKEFPVDTPNHTLEWAGDTLAIEEIKHCDCGGY
jgi:hypothetical protein